MKYTYRLLSVLLFFSAVFGAFAYAAWSQFLVTDSTIFIGMSFIAGLTSAICFILSAVLFVVPEEKI
jgi:hypothetical protein